jgi:hypothetical protein
MCGSNRATPQPAGHPAPQVAHTLADALRLIEAAESAGGKAARALPDTQTGDQAWVVGPAGNCTLGPGTVQLQSQSGGVDNPQFLAFAIYQLASHGGDSVGKLGQRVCRGGDQ